MGPDGFHPELRKAVQNFIKFDVESAGGRPSARAFFQDARDLLLNASSPPTILETPAEASERAQLGRHTGENRSGGRNQPQRQPKTGNGYHPEDRGIYHHASDAIESTCDKGDAPSTFRLLVGRRLGCRQGKRTEFANSKPAVAVIRPESNDRATRVLSPPV